MVRASLPWIDSYTTTSPNLRKAYPLSTWQQHILTLHDIDHVRDEATLQRSFCRQNTN